MVRQLVSEINWKTIFQVIYHGLVIASIITLGVSIYVINKGIETNHELYTGVISNIASTDNSSTFRAVFLNRSMDYVELLNWVDEHMEWVPSNVTLNERLTDPFKILENGTGRGRCGEHSYVYAAACWAQGYETRLVSAFVNGDHMWVEVKINESWIHVDPSPTQRINEPNAYAGRYYLVVYSYETSGHSEFLTFKYNPALLGHITILTGIIIFLVIRRQYITREHAYGI